MMQPVFFLFLGFFLVAAKDDCGSEVGLTADTEGDDEPSVSAQCTERTACSTHHLSCGAGRRILLTQAWRGFLRSGRQCHRVHYPNLNDCWCCFDDFASVCREEVEDYDALSALAAECSGKTECRPPKEVIRKAYGGQCGIWATAFSSYVQYLCVPETSILNTFTNSSSDIYVKETSVTLQRTISQPFSHRGSCRITSFRQIERMRMYSYAVVRSDSTTNWSITVTDASMVTEVFNASHPAKGEASSMAQCMKTLNTPIQIHVSVESNDYPDLVWIGFQSLGGHVTMQCQNLCDDCDKPQTSPPLTTQQQTSENSTNSTSDVTSAYNPSNGSHPTNSTNSRHDQMKGDDDDHVVLAMGLVIAVLGVVAIAGVVIFFVRRRLQQRKAQQNLYPGHTMAMDNAAYALSISQPIASTDSNSAFYHLQYDNATANNNNNIGARNTKTGISNPTYNLPSAPQTNVAGETAAIAATAENNISKTREHARFPSSKTGETGDGGRGEGGDKSRSPVVMETGQSEQPQDDDCIYEDIVQRSDNTDEDGDESGIDARSFYSGEFETVMDSQRASGASTTASAAAAGLELPEKRRKSSLHQYHNNVNNEDSEEQEPIYLDLEPEPEGGDDDYASIPNRPESEYSVPPTRSDVSPPQDSTTDWPSQREIDWLTSFDADLDSAAYEVPRSEATRSIYSNMDDDTGQENC